MEANIVRAVRACEVVEWTAGGIVLPKGSTCGGCWEPISEDTAFATDLGWMCGVCRCHEVWDDGIVSAWPTVADCVAEGWPAEVAILPAWVVGHWRALACSGRSLTADQVSRELSRLVAGRYTVDGEGDGAPGTPALDHELGGES